MVKRGTRPRNEQKFKKFTCPHRKIPKDLELAKENEPRHSLNN